MHATRDQSADRSVLRKRWVGMVDLGIEFGRETNDVRRGERKAGVRMRSADYDVLEVDECVLRRVGLRHQCA